MKKIGWMAAGLLLSGTLLTGTAFAAGLGMKVGGKAVVYQNGTPYTQSGYSLMPLRDLLVALGVSDKDISWDGTTHTVTAVLGGTTIRLTEGDNVIYKNGKAFGKLEVAAQERGGHVYLPARAVAEALGFKVGYDAKTNTVVIDQGSQQGAAGQGGAAGGSQAGSGASGQSSGQGTATTANTGASGATAGGNTGGQTTLGDHQVAAANGAAATLPKLDVGPGQLYGLIYSVDNAGGTLTLKLLDGSVKTVALNGSTKVTFASAPGFSISGTEYLQDGHAGMAALIGLSSDGKTAATFELVSVSFPATIVKIDSYEDTEQTGPGTTEKVSMDKVTLKLEGGVQITLNGMASEAASVKAGDQVTVTGALEDGKGYDSIVKS